MSTPTLVSVDATFSLAQRGRPALLDVAMVLPFLVAAFVDVPRVASLGPVTLMGALAALLMLLTLGAVLVGRTYPRRLLQLLAPWAMFLAWAALRTAVAGIEVAAMQNAVVYVLFGLTVLLGGMVASRSARRACNVIAYGIAWMDIVGLTMAFGSVMAFGLPRDGSEWFAGPRSVALVGLIAMSWHLALWVERVRYSGARAALWFLAIVLSLSRTATAVALAQTAIIVLLHARFAPRRLVARALIVVPALAVVAGVIVVNLAGVGERFTNAEFNVVEIGGVPVSTSGRSNVWPAIVESAEASPLVGWGLASSERVTTTLWESVGHPHNDYLRVWHDLGAIGLVLFLTAAVSWGRRLFIDACAALKHGAPPARSVLPLAGFLALLGLMLVAFTDNAIIYAFVMAPLGIIVGAGLTARREW